MRIECAIENFAFTIQKLKQIFAADNTVAMIDEVSKDIEFAAVQIDRKCWSIRTRR